MRDVDYYHLIKSLTHRNVYTANLATFPKHDGTKGATDQPGLKEMTVSIFEATNQSPADTLYSFSSRRSTSSPLVRRRTARTG